MPETDYAAEGTFAHAIAATCLIRGEDAHEHIGKSDGKFTVDEATAEHIQTYLNAVRCVGLHAGGLLEVESKCVLQSDVYGTADALVIDERSRVLHVFDLKFGAGVYVAAEGNVQEVCYAGGALLKHPVTCAKIDEVQLHIVQPRYGNGNPWRTWVLPIELFHCEVANVRAGALRTYAADAELVSGDHCRFCPAASTCPALHATALERTRELFDDDNLTPAAVPPAPEGLSPEGIAAVLNAAPLIERWLDAVRKHAHNTAKQGKQVPGWKLVERVGNRVWRDERATEVALLLQNIDCYTPRELVSPAEAERRLGKARRAIVGTLAMKPSTGTALVPVSDARPAIAAADVFSVIETATEDPK